MRSLDRSITHEKQIKKRLIDEQTDQLTNTHHTAPRCPPVVAIVRRRRVTVKPEEPPPAEEQRRGDTVRRSAVRPMVDRSTAAAAIGQSVGRERERSNG